MEEAGGELEFQNSGFQDFMERLMAEDSLEKAIEHVAKDYQREKSSQDLVTVLKFYGNILVRQGNQLQKAVWRLSQPELGSVNVRTRVLELIGLLIQHGADAGCRVQLHSDFLSSLNLNSDHHVASSSGDSSTGAWAPGQLPEYITCLGLAVALGDVSLVQLLLSSSTDINRVCFRDQTAIQLSMNRNSKVTRVLVEHGADILPVLQVSPERPHPIQITDPPLMQTLYSGSLYMASVLLQYGESPNERCASCDGNTPLHVAVLQGNLHMIDLLLKYGSDINCENTDNVTPLGLSLSLPIGGAVAEHLLKKGCDRYKKSSITRLQDLFTPLQVACFYGKVDLLHYWAVPESCPCMCFSRDSPKTGTEMETRMCNSCPPQTNSTTPRSGNLTPFLMAVWGGVLSAVNHIASLPGVDLAAHCDKGNAVHLAVLSSELAVLLCVIDLGCDVDMVSSEGNTPLHLAARLKRSDLCQALIQHGACLNVPDRNGETALSSSVYFGCEKNSLLLIHHGADLDTADSRGTTPLYWAIFTCRPCTLEKLIEAGVRCSGESFSRFPRNLRIMQNEQFIGWLRNQLCQPKPLQQLCGLAVRDVLKRKSHGRSIAYMIQSLPLPKTLKNCVTLSGNNCNSGMLL